MHLNWLVNPDPNLENKMRYFSDNFLFTNEYLGRLPNIPFDNPLSLTSKIIFQIENNIERAPRYFENHYNQLIKYFGAFMRKQVSEFNAVERGFATYSQCPAKEKKRVAWLKANPTFLQALRNVEAILERDLFSKVFLWISNYLQCPHKLKTHKVNIEFCSQILISLFRLNGHTKKQVAGYIDRILSTDRYEFPFPLEIYDRNKDDSFISLTEDYLNNRDFKRQFEGLKNLMINHEKRNGFFIYAINYVILDKEITKTFKWQIDKVTFISPSNSLFKKLRHSVKEVDAKTSIKMYQLFFSKHKLLAHVSIPFEDKEYAKVQAANIIKEELACLNEYLDSKMELRDENHLFTDVLNSGHWSGKRSLMKHDIEHIGGIKIDWLKDNPFELLRDHSFASKDQLLHNERTYVRAMQSEDSSLFWQYIENLFWFQNTDNDDVRKKFENIIMKNLDRFTDPFLLNIGQLFYGLHLSKFGHEISDDSDLIERISSELGYQQKVKFPIGKFRTKIKHPFVRSVISLYLQVKSKKNQQRWRDHFSSLILELQEYRNAVLHSGHANKYSRIKMNDLMQEIISKVRWGIIMACKKNKNLPFNELIKKLSN